MMLDEAVAALRFDLDSYLAGADGREHEAAWTLINAVERVRKLHTESEDGPYCTTCGPAYHTICCDQSAWPCPTIQALETP